MSLKLNQMRLKLCFSFSLSLNKKVSFRLYARLFSGNTSCFLFCHQSSPFGGNPLGFMFRCLLPLFLRMRSGKKVLHMDLFVI
ncbi:hypothetical protein V466_15920 [Pseudomonas mandelii PD30]|uniref:Uncharacterized protein n=1 Tax=Pseudomonas mandelii PD30 TaxID=1419583 RepID=A0A059L1A2_9PSED|nr:hypothetical protein V466_15920 [Pseudomonas mandelii PD30]